MRPTFIPIIIAARETTHEMFFFGGGVLVVLFLTLSTASAIQLSVDTDKIDSTLAAQLLEAQKKAANQASPPVSVATQAKEWAGIGKEIGSAFAESAKALSIETNEFIKTPVGKWTLFFVAWYLLGHKIWASVAAIFIWVLLGHQIIRSWRYFHSHEEFTADGTVVSKRRGYNFESNDARCWSFAMHGLAFGLLSLVSIVVILS